MSAGAVARLAAHDLSWLPEKVAAGWFDALAAAEAVKRDRAGLSGGAGREVHMEREPAHRLIMVQSPTGLSCGPRNV